MKHPFKQSASVVAWLIFAVAIGMLAMPRILSTASPKGDINPWLYIAIVISLVLVAAFGWMKMMKLSKPEVVDFWFAFAMGVMTSRIAGLAIPALYSDDGWTGFLIRLALMPLFIYLFWKMVKQMQKSWSWVERLHNLSNAWVVTVIAVSAAVIAVDIAPWVAIALLCCATVYDMWAVWKTGHMQKMAMFFINRRLIPGIAVPYKKGRWEKFAMLGGGDVFFIVLVATSFYRVDPLTMYVTAFAMTTAIIALMVAGKKGVFYPALPFILLGLVIGLIGRFTIW